MDERKHIRVIKHNRWWNKTKLPTNGLIILMKNLFYCIQSKFSSSSSFPFREPFSKSVTFAMVWFWMLPKPVALEKLTNRAKPSKLLDALLLPIAAFGWPVDVSWRHSRWRQPWQMWWLALRYTTTTRRKLAGCQTQNCNRQPSTNSSRSFQYWTCWFGCCRHCRLGLVGWF